MKFKTGTTIFFISLISISCLNSNIEEPILIIDPIEVVVGVWQEVEKKVDGEAREEIMDGHKLVLWSTEPDASENLDNQIKRADHYEYISENLGISVNKWGSIRFENHLVKFSNLVNGQSTVTTLKYLHDEETLTLRDTTVTPPMEVKLIKIELE